MLIKQGAFLGIPRIQSTLSSLNGGFLVGNRVIDAPQTQYGTLDPRDHKKLMLIDISYEADRPEGNLIQTLLEFYSSQLSSRNPGAIL